MEFSEFLVFFTIFENLFSGTKDGSQSFSFSFLSLDSTVHFVIRISIHVS